MGNTEKELAVLGGAEAKSNEGLDYKSEYEKLQKQLQTEKVEAGRLRKANEENAELRRKLAEFESQKRTESVLEGLDENLRADIPVDYQRGAAQIAQKAVDQTLTETRERLARLESDARVRNTNDFVERIRATYPGFLESINGGDKQEAWAQYQRNNAETIASAINRCDFGILSYHIKNFYSNHLGISIPSEDSGEAAPDPRSFGGGTSSQGINTGAGKQYSASDYQSILDKAQADFHAHKITYQQYVAICDEMSTAFKQGRVK